MNIAPKEFHKRRGPTNICKMNVTKVSDSDLVPYNKGKGYQYVMGYEVDVEKLIQTHIKVPRNAISCRVSQYDENFIYTMTLKISHGKAQ